MKRSQKVYTYVCIGRSTSPVFGTVIGTTGEKRSVGVV